MTVFVLMLLAAAFVGGLLLAAEGIARARVSAHLEQRCQEVAGLQATVSFSSKPLIWQSFSRSVSVVEIVSAARPGDLRMSLRVAGITGDDVASTLHLLTCHGFVPYPRIVELISERELFGSSPHKLTRIRGSARDRTIKVDLLARRGLVTMPVTVTLKPVLTRDGLHFRVRRVHAMVFGVPTSFVQGIVDEVADNINDTLGRFVQIEQIAIGDSGFDFYVRGEKIVVEANLTRPALRRAAK
ncbi:hypothetical protein HH308_06055 [Gordonia sp. TBRC 11910]|uniref:DUF2993 family protein n=1 Tax=Gordonia asplenii TaxID=2725283 RepID=A0A848KS33_9ACTN|nr:hypothetical protein [Gordonia asplenii]NMO00777.1 hypothetical protein [Gordonia asplenii]